MLSNQTLRQSHRLSTIVHLSTRKTVIDFCMGNAQITARLSITEGHLYLRVNVTSQGSVQRFQGCQTSERMCFLGQYSLKNYIWGNVSRNSPVSTPKLESQAI